MKKTFFKSILCASLFVGALTSCNEVEDLYNPELVREKAKKALGLDIAPDQDWNMTSVVTANITLNEDALSDYSFRIYSADPLVKNSGATILADYPIKTDVQGKASASFKFEMPSYLEYVYVARVDSHGRRMIGISKIQNGSINESFGENNSTSTRATNDYELPTMDSPYTEEQVNELIANSTDIATDNSLNATTIVPAGTTYSSDFSSDKYSGWPPQLGKYQLVVAGTLVINGNGQKRIAGLDIIIADGGELIFSKKLEVSQGSRIIVMEGGKVTNNYDHSITKENEQNNINYTTDDPFGYIYNAGTMNLGVVNFNNGAKIFNAKNGVIIAKTLNYNSENTEGFTNWGKIEAERIVSNWGHGEQVTINNGCLIRCDEIRAKNINLKENSAFEVKNLYVNDLYLREYSIVRSDLLYSKALAIHYVGKTDKTEYKALVSADRLQLESVGQSSNTGRFYVEANAILDSNGASDTQNATDRKKELKYNYNNNIIPCPVGEAPLFISSEATNNIENADCLGKGNTPNENVVEKLLNISNIYAFEDMSIDGGDYDMNDVVLECTKIDETHITIKLLAAGARKDVYAFFRDTRSNAAPINLFGELHEAFGQPSGTMINTGLDVNNLAPIEISEPITVEEGFLFSKHGDIYIVDYQNREAHISTFTKGFQLGDAPYAICVPTTWKYPKEWQRITIAYPEFKVWAEKNTNKDWFNHPEIDFIY